MRSLVRDDAYRVVEVLADGAGGKTELVSLGDEGLSVRKRIPARIANAAAWATVMGIEEPLLPQVESIYRMPDEIVVVYAYVEGESVAGRVARLGALGSSDAVRVICDVCRAAEALHGHNVVHRDITPGNVILASDGAHLVDLGIARVRTPEAKSDTTALGTWGYAAPEQYGFAQTDARSDVYALGHLLGFMLTGFDPGDERYAAAVADEQCVQPALARVVERASSFEPNARFQSAAELAAAAQEVVGLQSSGEVVGQLADDPSTKRKTAAGDGIRSREERERASVLEGDAPPRIFPLRRRKASASAAHAGRAEARGTSASPGNVRREPQGVSRLSELRGLLAKMLATGDETRSFDELPLRWRASLVASWIFSAVWACLCISSGSSIDRERGASYALGQVAAVIMFAGVPLVLAFDFYRAVVRRGPFLHNTHKLRTALYNVMMLIVLLFVTMFILAILIPDK